MKNADMPAMPTSPNSNDPEWAAARTGGLTKREIFAMHAMSNLSLADYQNPEHLAQDALAMADALLKELAK